MQPNTVSGDTDSPLLLRYLEIAVEGCHSQVRYKSFQKKTVLDYQFVVDNNATIAMLEFGNCKVQNICTVSFK